MSKQNLITVIDADFTFYIRFLPMVVINGLEFFSYECQLKLCPKAVLFASIVRVEDE